MSAKLNPFAASRALVFRTRPQFSQCRKPFVATQQCRRFAHNELPKSDTKEGMNEDTLPHISEETAAMDKIRGKEGPQIDEQGTPVQEVVKGDKEAFDKLPQVMKDEMKKNNAPKGSKSYHTSAIRRQDLISREPAAEDNFESLMLERDQGADEETAALMEGFKFEPPALPLPPGSHLKFRYDPLIQQVTNLIMEHGKKAAAQRNMALILQHLRTSPAPVINPARPLLPGSPPPTHLPLNPILYLTLIIDSVAPLMKIRSIRGAAGGGVALQVPSPLGLRQRRRQAMMWIIDAGTKRRNRGSGKGMLAQRIAEELIAVAEGRSSVWTRRDAVHKLAVSARANLNLRGRR